MYLYQSCTRGPIPNFTCPNTIVSAQYNYMYIKHRTLTQSLCSVCRSLMNKLLSKHNVCAILTRRRNCDTLEQRHTGTAAYWNEYTLVLLECAVYWTCVSLACAIVDSCAIVARKRIVQGLAMRSTETMAYSYQQPVLFQWRAGIFGERAPNTNPFLTKRKKSDDRHVRTRAF